jgi:acyl-CoA synthetase (NDP forming)
MGVLTINAWVLEDIALPPLLLDQGTIRDFSRKNRRLAKKAFESIFFYNALPCDRPHVAALRLGWAQHRRRDQEKRVMAAAEKDLERFFEPKSIAIVGVSKKRYRFGGMSFLKKLRECGFPGSIYPINPKAGELGGLRAYPDLSSLPEVPDLAIVCVAASSVPSILEECGRIGLRHIHVLSAGFKETATTEGKALEAQVESISREKGLLVIGPNCMGAYCPASRLTAWGAIPGMSGPLGVISQSGAITQRVTEYACSLGIGVDKAVSFGNATVLDAADYLEFMAADPRTQVIAMYLDSVQDGRRFFRLAKEVNKPIIIWKGGETEVGALTAASHTGAMSGERRIWEGLYRQTGAIPVHSMDEWADAILALTRLPAPAGRGVFLIGGGGGNSVAHGDDCIREGLDVPRLSEATLESLRRSVPTAGSIAGNPLDMFRVFQDAAYLGEILDLADQDPSIGMIIVNRVIPRKIYHLPDLPDPTPETIRLLKRRRQPKPTVFSVDSEGGDPDLAQKGAALRGQLCRAGIPAFPSTRRAAKALVHLHRYHAFRKGAGV